MALEVNISLEGDPAAVLEKAKKPILEGAARATSNVLIKHFRARNQSRERRPGWKKSNYWAEASDSVTSEVGEDRTVATVRKEGVRLHWLGGVVKPKNGHKALAIPADPSVAGIWPSEYKGKPNAGPTFLVWKKGESSGMIATRKKKGNEIVPLWWLVAKTTHRPDPTVIPSVDDFATAVSKAYKTVLKALKGGAA